MRGHYRQKKWGRRRIVQDLKQKGISEFCIKSGLKEIDGEEYYQNLVEVMEKKDRQEKEKNPRVRRMKISQYLTGKGYEQDLIKMALDELGKATRGRRVAMRSGTLPSTQPFAASTSVASMRDRTTLQRYSARDYSLAALGDDAFSQSSACYGYATASAPLSASPSAGPAPRAGR